MNNAGWRYRRIVAAAACVATIACLDNPDTSLTRPDEFVDTQTLTAISWIGLYDGWGEVTVAGSTEPVRHLQLRIAFDADSIRNQDCSACVTVTLDPWFSLGNVSPPLASELFLRYVEDGLERSLAVTRYSGAGQTANALLVTVNHELAGPPKELLIADLEFRAR